MVNEVILEEAFHMAYAIPMVTSTGQPVLLLKEGTGRSMGEEARKNNILAATLVSAIVKTSLGPMGMDKMLMDGEGNITITNDGAVMLKEMKIEHPAAKIMVDTAKAVDAEVGDGTTSVVVLAGALLEEALKLMEKEIHPTVIIEGYKQASQKALEIYGRKAVKVKPEDRDALVKIASTSMASKLASADRDFLAPLAVEAIEMVKRVEDGEINIDIDDVRTEKKPGGRSRDTAIVKGVALQKEVIHSGMPKRVKKARIALINFPLEMAKTKLDARVHITSPEQMMRLLDEEDEIIKEKILKIVETGANVLVSTKAVEDVAQHYLAKHGVYTIRMVKDEDMDKVRKAVGGRIVTRVEDLTGEDLGDAEIVEERRIEEENWTFIEGCKNPRSVTIFIRGGSEKVVDEIQRALHDALSVVKDTILKPYVVGGGGSLEAEAALRIRDWAATLKGKEQLAAIAFADALEAIPITLAENAGLDVIDIGVELKSRHEAGELWAGIDVLERGITDMFKKDILEPLVVKEQVVKAATEAASLILRVDDIIAATRIESGRGRGPRQSPY